MRRAAARSLVLLPMAKVREVLACVAVVAATDEDAEMRELALRALARYSGAAQVRGDEQVPFRLSSVVSEEVSVCECV